jgi:hypothetical protein
MNVLVREQRILPDENSATLSSPKSENPPLLYFLAYEDRDGQLTTNIAFSGM